MLSFAGALVSGFSIMSKDVPFKCNSYIFLYKVYSTFVLSLSS